MAGPKMQAKPPSPGTSSSALSQRWDAVLDLCKARLQPVDFQAVSQLKSVEELIHYGATLQSRYQQSTKSYELARMSDFFGQLRSFHSSLDVLVHVQPSVAAPLWGSIRLCVELVHQTDEVFQIVVDMFDEINHTLPRIVTFMEILGESPTLLEPSRDLYLLIAEFACHVINYYRNNPLKNLLAATWKPFRLQFEKIVSKIRQKGRQIELEAQTLSMQRDAIRHEELKRLLLAFDLKSKTQLPCYYLPDARNPAFVGRDDVLEDIRGHLNAHTNEQRTVAVYGLGGVGKTQVCLEYIYRNMESYAAIFFLTADTVVKLAQDTRGALTKLGVIDEQSHMSDQQCRAEFMSWLQDTEEKWLIVFDNADDLKTLKGYWPASKRGHILMSSRDPAAARYPVINKATQGMNLLPFSLSAGVDMLFGLISGEVDSLDSSEDTAGRDPEEMKLAEELVKQLGGLPLALNQTANYMLEAECDLREFSELFFDYQNRSTLLDQDPGHMHMSYPHSLKTVWDISMTRVDQGNTNSRHLLQILSLFDPDGIPEDLLDGPKGQRSPLPPSLSYLRNKIGYLNTVKPLLQQSMITKNKASQTISIHRLVSAITVSKISPGDRQTRFEEAVELLYRVYPQLSVKKASLNEDWRDCRLYIAQVTALEKCYRESDSPLLPVAKFATLLANASWFLFEQGLPSQSMQLLPTARAVGEATSAGNELAVSTIYRCSGGIYLDVNKPEAAFDNFNRQMTIMESLEGGSGLAVAAGLSNCALAKLSMGDYAESRKYIERAQEIRDRYPGQALSYRALTIDVLGILDGLEGNTDGALRNINEAIKLYDEELGYGNYLTVFANYSLGNVYIAREDYEEAFRLHSLALSARRDVVGETYRTAASLHKVAWLLHRRKEYKAAEDMLLSALKIFTNSYEGRGGVGRSSYLMNMVLEELGRKEDAENTKRFAEGIRKDILGLPPGENDTLESYDKLVGAMDR